MTATVERIGFQARATGKMARPAGGVLFDWAAIVVGGLIVGGFYLDAWAHNHGKVDNTFFTS